ncbi:MAG: hypothetical protein K6F82_06440 [Sphaerochaetaceae bacterium]|nr:hypothetical protein [Sphaerochaetaceae bacterium]
MKNTFPPLVQDIYIDDSLKENLKQDKKRGAVVCGLPKSRELTSFMDTINPDLKNQRMLSMFFSGKLFSPDMLDFSEDLLEDGDQ